MTRLHWDSDPAAQPLAEPDLTPEARDRLAILRAVAALAPMSTHLADIVCAADYIATGDIVVFDPPEGTQPVDQLAVGDLHRAKPLDDDT